MEGSVCSVGLFRTRCHGTAVVGTEVAMAAEGVAATHSKCSSPTGIMGMLLLRIQEILKRKCKTHHDYVYSFLIYYSVCLLPSFGYKVLCQIFTLGIFLNFLNFYQVHSSTNARESMAHGAKCSNDAARWIEG